MCSNFQPQTTRESIYGDLLLLWVVTSTLPEPTWPVGGGKELGGFSMGCTKCMLKSLLLCPSYEEVKSPMGGKKRESARKLLRQFCDKLPHGTASGGTS